MNLSLTDELLGNITCGTVEQLTENEEDRDISCVFVDLDVGEVIRTEADSIMLTRSDLFKLLGQLEECNER